MQITVKIYNHTSYIELTIDPTFNWVKQNYDAYFYNKIMYILLQIFNSDQSSQVMRIASSPFFSFVPDGTKISLYSGGKLKEIKKSSFVRHEQKFNRAECLKPYEFNINNNTIFNQYTYCKISPTNIMWDSPDDWQIGEEEDNRYDKEKLMSPMKEDFVKYTGTSLFPTSIVMRWELSSTLDSIFGDIMSFMIKSFENISNTCSALFVDFYENSGEGDSFNSKTIMTTESYMAKTEDFGRNMSLLGEKMDDLHHISFISRPSWEDVNDIKIHLKDECTISYSSIGTMIFIKNLSKIYVEELPMLICRNNHRK